jgi:hypothetical protein
VVTAAPPVEKRDGITAPQPDWFFDFDYWGGAYVQDEACSCLVPSPLSLSTTTITVTENIIHTTVSLHKLQLPVAKNIPLDNQNEIRYPTSNGEPKLQYRVLVSVLNIEPCSNICS